MSPILVFVILLAVHGACALDCYVCTSGDSGCGESISKAVLLSNGKVASGCVSCMKTFSALGTIWSSVTRSCGYLKKDSCTNDLGYGSCTCTTAFCNGVSATSASGLRLFVMVFVLRCVLWII